MVYIAADKHGFKVIRFVEEYLKSHNIPFENLGVRKEGDDMKLEDMIPPLVEKVRENENEAPRAYARGIFSFFGGAKSAEASSHSSPIKSGYSAKADNLGIFSCGTGVGVEVGANKFSGIRACLATTSKIAEWSKIYDNCNVLCLVGWETDKKTVENILDAWFSAEYDGDQHRLNMMKAFDSWH